MSEVKVNLTLLKHLVSELESSLLGAEELKKNKESKHLYVTELSKASGLAAGILTEAGMLIGDIQYLSTGVSGLAPTKGTNAALSPLEKLLGGLKGSGGSN